jgi:hypothetical protein
MMIRPSIVIAVLLGLAGVAGAEALGQIHGRVLDKEYGLPVEGALVHIAGPNGMVKALRSGADGSFGIIVKPGTYRVLFAFGKQHSVGEVLVEPGALRRLDARIDALVGEVIVIHEQLPPKKLPVAQNFPRWKAAPHSQKSLASDAWTRAWLLVDISPTGDVTRFKWLKRPGYDLEKIAEAEVWKLKFSPAIDANGKVSRLYAFWKFEWVSQSWNNQIAENTQGRLPNEYETEYIPCAGTRGWNWENSPHTNRTFKGYRDCSTPDLAKARGEEWVNRPTR